MPSAVEPGTRLAGRYRLREPAGPTGLPGDWPGRAADGTVHWLAHDEMLNRYVGVRVLSADAPYAATVLAAARRAATLDDPRFLAILDADRTNGLAYVVTEWSPSRDLADLVAAGPLAPAEAQWIAVEVARGLAVAHAAGLAHRRLVPEAVLRTESGRVKVVGLGVDAALDGADPRADEAAVAEDLHGMGAVLYAGLTGRWPLGPGGASTRLAPAAVVDGAPCSPRQMRAAVPPELDDVACRAVGAPLRRGSTPLLTAAQFAAQLTGTPGGAADPASTGPLPAVARDGEEVPLLAAPADPGRAGRVAMVVVGAVVAVGVGLLGWQIVAATDMPSEPSRAPAGAPTASPAPNREPLPPGTDITVVDVLDFDPQGDGEEHGDEVHRVLDDDADTAWMTQEYYNSPFGGLKTGVGLVLDLGEPREVGTVTVRLMGRGSDVELRAAPVGELPETADRFEVVASAEGVASLQTLRPPEPVRARYLLLWFTALPTIDATTYRGGITEVRVRS